MTSARKRAIAVLEPRTALAYERSELVADETAARVAALSAWRSGRARVLVASVQALVQHTLAPDDLPAQPRVLKVGTRVSLEPLVRELFDLGYVPVLEVAGRGEFARRGGLVDVFPPSAALPVRLEFFGDEIDSLRAFDPTDQRSVESVAEVTLLPATEFLLPSGGVVTIAERLGRLAPRLPERLAADLLRFEGEIATDGRERATTEGRALAVGDAAEVWAPVLAPSTALDHLDPGTLLVLDEPGELVEAGDFLWRQAEERLAELVESGDLPRTWPTAYLARKAWTQRLAAGRTLELTWESEPHAAEGMSFAAGGLSSGDAFGWREPVLPPGRTERLVDAVEHWAGERARVVIASDQAPRLSELLGEAGRPVAIVHRISEPPPPGAVALIERSLNGGFAGGPDGLAFVTDRELFGSVRVRRPKAMRRVVPRDILERLTPGDLVVHIDHGIARYERMLRRGGEGEERDYLELAFQAGDRIFVPVEQINRVTRYSGGESPALSRLGGTDWLRTKQRVRKAVTDLAEELLKLYAQREGAAGFAFATDGPWQSEMEASFPYEETVDQLAQPPRSRSTWRLAGRWTGWSSATSATARPRSRCALRSRPHRTASRSPSSCPRPSSRGSTSRPSRSASRHSPSRWGSWRGSSRPASRSGCSMGCATAPSTWSSGRTGCCRRTSGSVIWAWSWSTRSSASASRRRRSSSSSVPRSTS